MILSKESKDGISDVCRLHSGVNKWSIGSYDGLDT